MKKYNDPGQIHFVTFRTYNNTEFFIDEFCCRLFLKILDKLREELKFKIFAFCILLDHIHLLMQLKEIDFARGRREPPDELTVMSRCIAPNEFGVTRGEEPAPSGVSPNLFGGRREPPDELAEADISYVGKRIKGYTARELNKYLNRKGSFWKHRFYDFNIYSDKKFNEKLKYIHDNPVNHGIVKDIADYKYCSWRNYELNDQSIFKIDYFQY